MLSRVWSSTVLGVDALPIEVETHTRGGLPRFYIVGLPDGAVRESRDRIIAALRAAELPRPRGTITVNLAPANVRKQGTALDLPIAIGLIAAASEDIDPQLLEESLIVGELSLHGPIRPVRGILPMTLRARNDGKKRVLVPAANAEEAAIVDDIDILPVRSLKEACQILSGQKTVHPFRHNIKSIFSKAQAYPVDFAEVRGQLNAKRAMEVAAAGGHNLLMVGPPGSGKTMLARRLPTILPALTLNEALETTKILSVGGKLKSNTGLIATRPFRSPHHTISDAGLCGGGANPQPGEISCAHNGILFLDELPEFKRQALEVLRQPLEEGMITISRARFSVVYPARFMLVASMNPCLCGYLTDPSKPCSCTPQQIQRYLSKVSGPLLDRIDVHVEVMPVPFEDISSVRDGELSAAIRDRVMQARQIQSHRFKDHNGVYCNAMMGTKLVRHFCGLDEACTKLMKMAIDRLGLSARAYDRILKVARTVADLAGSEGIESAHLSEAIQYRALDRKWGELRGR